MRLATLLSSAALALTASAFLVPLEVTGKADVTAGSLLPGAKQQTINLDCPDCPIALQGATAEFAGWNVVEDGNAQPSSSLELTFTAERDQVKLNDVRIFPPPLPRGLPIRAKQVTSEKNLKVFEAGVPLSTSIEIRMGEPIVGANDEGVLKIHSVSVEIVGLAERVVRADTLRLLIAEGDDGELMLLPIETTSYQHSPAKDSCTNVFCRARVIIAAKLAAFRAAAAARLGMFKTGCMRPAAPKEGHRGPFVKGGPNKFAGHLQPHAQQHHKFRHTIRRIIRHIILPIFFGITAGMVVGAFSMLVLTAVASIVARVRGTKPPSYESVAQAEDGSRTSMEEPPKYDEVYAEPEEDVTDEKRRLL